MFEYVAGDGAEEFDRYVRKSPGGHFMQTSAWGRVKSDWEWTGILLRGEDGSILGTIALLFRKGRRSGATLVYAPRGPVWPRERPEILEKLLSEAVRFAKGKGAYLLRVDPDVEEGDRPFLALMRRLRFKRRVRDDYSLFQPRLTYESALRGVSVGSLPECYHRSTRRNLHLAEKSGVKVTRHGEEELPAFMELMRKTAARNGFQPREEDYFRRILRAFGPEAGLYAAKIGEKTVAAAIAVHVGERSSFFYGCSSREGMRLRANEAVIHGAEADAIRAGCGVFDFRGVEGFPVEDNPHFGLHRFKMGFGASFRISAGEFDRVLKPVTALLLEIAEGVRRLFRRHRREKPGSFDGV